MCSVAENFKRGVVLPVTTYIHSSAVQSRAVQYSEWGSLIEFSSARSRRTEVHLLFSQILSLVDNRIIKPRSFVAVCVFQESDLWKIFARQNCAESVSWVKVAVVVDVELKREKEEAEKPVLLLGSPEDSGHSPNTYLIAIL